MAQVNDFYPDYPFNDGFIDSIKFGKGRKTALSMLVVHYAVARSLKWLVDYFHEYIWTKDHRQASTHFCIGQDGETVSMVKFDDTAWTIGNGGKYSRFQSLAYSNMKRGWWIDHNGSLSSLVNDMSINFETCLYPQDPVTADIYAAVAQRCRYFIRKEKHTRVWRICGHEHMCPDYKRDPGRQWDWKKFFTGYLEVRPDFYDEYLSYLDETKFLDPTSFKEKRRICLDAAKKIHKELHDKGSSFALRNNWLQG